MTNSDIVEILETTSKLLELHGADSFKIRSYGSAVYNLDKYNERPLREMTVAELTALPGVGKGIAAKIIEISHKGTTAELDQLLEQTPAGLLEMFKINGIGPKKIGVIWRETGINTLYDLEIGCQNGVIAQLKGFGANTQSKILESIQFLKSHTGMLRIDQALHLAEQLLKELQGKFEKVEITGEVRRNMEVVNTLSFLVGTADIPSLNDTLNTIHLLEQRKSDSSPFIWRGKIPGFEIHVEIFGVAPERYENELFLASADENHWVFTGTSGESLYKVAKGSPVVSESAIYEKIGLPFVVPEMREGLSELDWARQYSPDDLITWNKLRGILHNHSTWSDGKNSIKEMAEFCRSLGFDYLGMADHSQTAVYANGLNIDRVMAQLQEIDTLNKDYQNQGIDFRIFKGIESDILGDGSLDYPVEILAKFDYIVASVHANLNMTEEKATERLLNAIANPYTTILGHPTGRLLLSRKGYPLDHAAVIDACAKHNVVIEINANPWRLDLDWRWISYAMEKGVLLSINPDAHELNGYYDMKYGTLVARKGGLTHQMTLNAKSLNEITAYFASRNPGII